MSGDPHEVPALLRQASDRARHHGRPALAEWLRSEADSCALHQSHWVSPSRGVDDPPAVAYQKPDKLAELTEWHYRHALAVAAELWSATL